MEALMVGAQFIAFIASLVALVAFVQVGKAQKKQQRILQAIDKLLEIEELLKQRKIFSAFDAIGMTGDWYEEMTLQEASEVFAVRLENLRREAMGESRGA